MKTNCVNEEKCGRKKDQKIDCTVRRLAMTWGCVLGDDGGTEGWRDGGREAAVA